MSSATDNFNVAFFTAQLLGTMTGNFVLLLALRKSKDLNRSVSSNLMFNCAVIDFTSAVINIPLAMDYLIFQTGNLNGSVAPVLINSMFTFWMLLMQHSAIVMMADRLMIIKHPSCYHTRVTVKKGRVAIGMMWLSAITWSCVMYTVRGLQQSQEYFSPLEYMSRHHLATGKYVVVGGTLISVLGNGTVCFLVRRELVNYTKKKIASWKSTSEGEFTVDRAKLQRSKAEVKRNTKSCNTVLVILLTHMISVFPSLVISFVNLVRKSSSPQPRQISTIIIMTIQLNSLLNPYIFISRSSKYRRLLKRQFRRLWLHRQVTVGQN